ncbi:hypothetical protein CYMTET_29965 [Cymbomonas tetramitiformis]|uniref:Uncharacterized protein n=1 Tax=Cymbomonas tetramitiformis TaxID=36881 RepID=A0AAE0FK15_9CHLO|nr:hypothetical protein CYMTET_29965 [Cymbomonas tetramitiformis]
MKLLDLDYEYEVYHLTLNELLCVALPTVLRGTALSLYEEPSFVHPHDGRCALQRLRFHVEGIGGPDAHRFWVRLRAIILDETDDPAPQRPLQRPAHVTSATASPHVTPLYLVVLRDLAANHPFTYAALALRLSKTYRDEKPAWPDSVSVPASGGDLPASGGGGRSDGGRIPGGSALAFGDRRMEKPVGDWKPIKNVRAAHPDPGINLTRHISDEDDEDWPAFRAGPLYIPPAASGNRAGVNRDRAPPSGGAGAE